MAAGASLLPASGFPSVYPVGPSGGGGVGALAVAKPNNTQVTDDIRLFLSQHGGDGQLLSTVQMSEGHTIKDVRMRITAQKGWFASGNTIMSAEHSGKENTDDEVPEIETNPGTHLHIVVKLADLLFIRVKDSDDREHQLTVPRSTTVRTLKEKIEDVADVDVEQQQLVVRGRELEDHLPLVEFVDSSSTLIHLVVRRSAKVKVKPVAGSAGKEYEVEISSDDTASSIKDKLEVAGGLPRSNSRLFYNEEMLDESIPLARYGIEDGSSLELEEVPMFSLSPPLPGSSPPLSSAAHSLAAEYLRAKEGLKHGQVPTLAAAGTGGTYFLRDTTGSIVAVFKPEDEEPLAHNNPRGNGSASSHHDGSGEGLKCGIRIGEGAVREVAAFLLDHGGFSGVPPTALVNCRSTPGKHVGLGDGVGVHRASLEAVGLKKRGSLQKFIPSTSDCEEMGTSAFPPSEVHKICVLDMRLGNTDRNGANILACKGDPEDVDAPSWTLVPIDHGYALPSSLKDIYFDWLSWRQARVPFDEAAKEYVSELDAERDLEILTSHGIALRPQCATVLRVCTMLLKKGVAAGLTASEIGGIMSRESVGMSVLEKISAQTVKVVAAGVRERSAAPRSYAAVAAKAGDLTEVSSTPESLDEYMTLMGEKIDEYLVNAFEPAQAPTFNIEV